MNNIYTRLKALYEKIGIEANENSPCECAELNAITAALEELENRISGDEATLFSSENENYIRKRCELMSLNPSWFEDDELLEKINTFYAERKSVFDLEEYNRDLERLNIADAVSASYLHITVSGDKVLARGVPLRAVGWFLRQYLCPAAVAEGGENGLTFNEWEEYDYRFADIDAFDLSFDYLETI